jgi:hypothetical protein
LGTGGAPLACDPRGSYALWPRVTRLEKGFRWREMLTIFAFQRRDSPMASLMTALARARTRCALEWMRTAASVLSMVNVEGDGAQWPWRVGSTSVITAAIVSARVDAHWGSTPACDFTYDGVTTSCCRSQREMAMLAAANTTGVDVVELTAAVVRLRAHSLLLLCRTVGGGGSWGRGSCKACCRR